MYFLLCSFLLLPYNPVANVFFWLSFDPFSCVAMTVTFISPNSFSKSFIRGTAGASRWATIICSNTVSFFEDKFAVCFKNSFLYTTLEVLRAFHSSRLRVSFSNYKINSMLVAAARTVRTPSKISIIISSLVALHYLEFISFWNILLTSTIFIAS